MNARLSTNQHVHPFDTGTSVLTSMPMLASTALVWIAYVFALALIDIVLLPQVMPAINFYLVHLAGGLLLLGFARFMQKRADSFDARPIAMGWIVLLTTLAGLPSIAGPIQNGAESMALRGLPVMMLALILVAWCYHWHYVIAFSLGTALLTCAPLLLLEPTHALLMGPTVVVAAIQTTSFLAVGGSVAMLMRQLRAQQQALEHANQQLRHFADIREQLGASQERSRIAREVHDTLAHTLSGLSIQLEGVDALWERDPAHARVLVGQAQAVVRGGLQETRRAVHALRAGPIEQLGLVPALRQLASISSARANLRLELVLPDALPTLSEAIEHGIYRIAQEALTNVVRHAAATTLWVQLHVNNQCIELIVRDDGLGIANMPFLRSDQYGLHGLHERAAALGGELRIVSEQPSGTTIQLVIPW